MLTGAASHLLFCTILFALPVCGQATLVYSGHLGQWLGSSGVDVDNDGTAEISFDTAPVTHIPGMRGEVYSVRTASGSSLSIDGPLYGESLHLLPFGAPIGGSTPPHDWSSRDLRLPVLFVLSLAAPPYDLLTMGPLIQAGNPAFVGMRFQMPDGMHYGRAQLTIEPTDRPRAFLVDWAYETRPAVPVAAGIVPEPAVSALLIAGGALLAWGQGGSRGTKEPCAPDDRRCRVGSGQRLRARGGSDPSGFQSSDSTLA